MTDYYKFQELVITDTDDNKPNSLANSSFPYNSLTPRRFEELNYLLFKNKITCDPSFAKRHSEIQIMTGVGEKGRDCALFYEGRFSGIIQCKNYSKAVDKSTCLKEIIKPFAHAVIGNLLIPNPLEFEYYLIAAHGFNDDTNAMLADFASFVKTYPLEINKAFKGLKTFKAFENIEYNHIQKDLFKLLGSINVIPLSRQDIDDELLKHGNESIIQNFFEVRSIIDDKALKVLTEELIKRNEISPESIYNSFDTASLQLKQYSNEFDGLPNSHIQREETHRIIDWINADLRENDRPVKLLVGEPGSGKSVILRDVYDQLCLNKIPVIALKADRYYVSSLSELEIRATLPHSFLECIKLISNVHDRTVLLIDQIDAISQSVRSTRDCIDTYTQLIHNIEKISSVRIVISIRKFDLEYDYEFSHITNSGRIDVNPLTRSQVLQVTRSLGVADILITNTLYTLLSNPNYLNIFCKIHKGGIRPGNITSVRMLYDELWRKSTENHLNKEEVIATLFEIAEEMQKTSCLTITTKVSWNLKIIDYLKRTELINTQDDSLQFFHQTFYDYVWARSFITKKHSVISYLRQEKQSIYIRSSLKMVLNFLRIENYQTYTVLIEDILFSSWVRWHIKSLVLEILAFEDNPQNEEVKLVENKILIQRQFALPFIEAIRGKTWLSIIIKNKYLEKLLNPTPTTFEKILLNLNTNTFKKQFPKLSNRLFEDFSRIKNDSLDIWFNLLRNNLPHNRDTVLQYLNTLSNIENKSSVILRLLIALKTWDNPLSQKLYEENANDLSDSFINFMLLEDAVVFDHEWVYSKFEKFILESFLDKTKHIDGTTQHYVEQLATTISQKMPEQYFNFCLRVINVIIDRDLLDNQFYSGKYYKTNYSHLHIEYARKEHAYGSTWFLYSAIDVAKCLCKERNPTFDKFLNETKNTTYKPLLIIILITLAAFPTSYPIVAFEIITIVALNDGFLDQEIAFYIQETIKTSYSLFSTKQQDHINKLILELKNPQDLCITIWNGEKQFINNFGFTSYNFLHSIPQSNRQTNPLLKRRYAELERRFGKINNTYPFKHGMYRVTTPLAASAYENMNLESWEESFKKYDANYQPIRGSEQGGINEHCRAFTTYVSKNPDFFLPLIEKIIDKNGVNIAYQIAGIDGLKAAKYCPKKFSELYKKLIHVKLDASNTLFLIHLAEYLTKQGAIDSEIFSFICENAIPNDEHEDLNADAPKYDALNSVAGAAIYIATQCDFNKEYVLKILDVLENIAHCRSQSIRISALMNLPKYIEWDRERSKVIFYRLIRQEDKKDVFRTGLYFAYHYAKYNFQAMVPFLRKSLEFDDCQQDASLILVQGWFRKEKESSLLLKNAWSKYPKVRASVIEVTASKYLNSKTFEKRRAKKLFQKFLNDTSQEVMHSYSIQFLHLNPEDFKDVLPLLKKYSKSHVAAKSAGYYFDYLLRCYRAHPKECIDLLSYSLSYRIANITDAGHYDSDKSIKILIGSYNALYTDRKKNDFYIKKCLSLFDKILRNPTFRTAATRVVDTV